MNLNIKDINQLDGVITTIKETYKAPIEMYCSQSFYDKLFTFCTDLPTISPGLETGYLGIYPCAAQVYIRSQIPEDCAVIQADDVYILKFVRE